jgi:lysophospholipase L1-like esterase
VPPAASGLRVVGMAWLASGLMGSSVTMAAGDGAVIVPARDPRVAVMGRVDVTDPARLRLGYPGVTLRLRFEGPLLAMQVIAATPNSHLAVLVDGGEARVVRLPQGESEVVLAEGLANGEHGVDVVHRTETWVGAVSVLGFRLAPNGRLLDPLPWPRRRMLFIGDSVTCGEGVARSPGHRQGDAPDWNPYLSYGMLLARKLDAQCHLVCYGGRGLVRDWRGRRDVLNAPQFFDLALPDEEGAPVWDHRAYVPDVVVVSLGTNDFNPSIGEFPEREEWVGAYVRFVRAIRSRYPEAQVLLTEGAIVNDTPERAQRSTLHAYIAETVGRVADPRVRAVESRHYAGDEADAHPPGAAHAAMARDLEPLIRAIAGW